MGLSLAQALRLMPTAAPAAETIAFVGAGGKTTAMFQLARELPPPVLVTTSTHLGIWQVPLAHHHLTISPIDAIEQTAYGPYRLRQANTQGPSGKSRETQAASSGGPELAGVVLVTGSAVADDRLSGLSEVQLLWLHDIARTQGVPLLIEADGARQKPLKAPGPHEPAIPPFAGLVVVVAGLSGLGKPLSERFVHRAEQFALQSTLRPGELVSADSLARILKNPHEGGLKNVPVAARRIALLNQADSNELRAQARGMLDPLLRSYDAVLICSLQTSTIHAVHEPTAGIVLAAGGSRRLGQPKQLLDWHGEPFVRAVAETALKARLDPVVVVTGSDADGVAAALDGLPVLLARNEGWESGQASSIRVGLEAAPERIGGAVFLLADQPQVTFDVITALVGTHALGLQPIVAPLVRMERRANPVLFDRVTFRNLRTLQGDVGGRAIFDKYPVEYMPWYDDRLLLDVDTMADYERLIEDDTL